MTEKSFKGKAIYNPSGKAGEYSYWACNFYVGCSNGCEYCYCKKGIMKSSMGADVPTLKKCFRNEGHAKDVFEKEMLQNREELKKHGLFFSFSTDPMLKETIELTLFAITLCLCADIPVKILTKRADFFSIVEYFDREFLWMGNYKSMIAFGFTLTGRDEIEPGASTNTERIEAMKKLHASGFKTWASIEPIIDIPSSLKCIEETLGYCDLYKIGMLSGGSLPKEELRNFIGRVCYLASKNGAKVYWKDGLKKYLGRDIVSAATVDRDYNIFKEIANHQ